MDAIKKTITRKVVNSKGGKVCLSGGSMETWQASIETKPVIVRRAIENITFFIQSDKIPELSEIALARVREKINEAIETYIQMNVHNGCMNRTSPSFNWVANVDDDSCAPPEQNSQFGGFIRTCTEDKRLKQCIQVGVKDVDVKSIFADRRATSFSNEEEAQIKTTGVIPFLVETRLRELGAKFEKNNKAFGSYVAVDGQHESNKAH
ncbi:unnamed protein product [Rotaria sp. Silwood1]|nr:unnamed protein product [Rotaria sp. Silwood1]CAF3720111.1 unnamed protein product [Rotaria sp. Silwood1]CAF4925673.1 unnamed protein product [Rotaria sp. Silwood1]